MNKILLIVLLLSLALNVVLAGWMITDRARQNEVRQAGIRAELSNAALASQEKVAFYQQVLSTLDSNDPVQLQQLRQSLTQAIPQMQDAAAAFRTAAGEAPRNGTEGAATQPAATQPAETQPAEW